MLIQTTVQFHIPESGRQKFAHSPAHWFDASRDFAREKSLKEIASHDHFNHELRYTPEDIGGRMVEYGTRDRKFGKKPRHLGRGWTFHDYGGLGDRYAYACVDPVHQSDKNRKAANEFLVKSLDTLATFNPKLGIASAIYSALSGDLEAAKKAANKATFGLLGAAVDGKLPDFKTVWSATPMGMITDSMAGKKDLGAEFECGQKASIPSERSLHMFIEPDVGKLMVTTSMLMHIDPFRMR